MDGECLVQDILIIKQFYDLINDRRAVWGQLPKSWFNVIKSFNGVKFMRQAGGFYFHDVEICLFLYLTVLNNFTLYILIEKNLRRDRPDDASNSVTQYLAVNIVRRISA